ncbi:MAG: nucleoside deaminase [Fibromonadales bacterium]|nr:nucleoside deaminase [Fibromonadales bacterium]
MFSQEDHKWMAQALELAESAAANGETPIGAVIVLNGEKIAAAKNSMEEMRSATAHAEILAINEAGQTLKNWRLDGATLYVSLEPCPMCWGAIKNSRISKVVFAASNVGAIPCGCPVTPPNNSPIAPNSGCPVTPNDFPVVGGLLEKESVDILQNFFRNVRKTKNDSGNKG